MCDFRVARVPVSECPVFPWELVEPQGGFHFFTRRGSNFLRMWIIHREKGTLGRTCKGPAMRLILEKRDKYEKN